MTTILDKILETKKQEVAAIKNREAKLRAQAFNSPQAASFFNALMEADPPFLIAEVKKASPSKGIIREDFDPVEIAKAYERGGANALSVLTDEQYFQGHLDYLKEVHAAVQLPLLRKDFLIDPVQVYEAKIFGASAVLLIAAALDADRLAELSGLATKLGLDYLLEVHAPEELEVIAKSGIEPRIMGINNRNLKNFEVSLEITKELVPLLPSSTELVVSESGIHSANDIQTVLDYGAAGVLVGESLMRQPDVEVATRELINIEITG